MNKPAAHASDEQTPAPAGTLKPAGVKDLTQDPEDGALVERAVGGDATAFEELFLKHRQRLYAVAWRLMRNEDAALDVVQEAFVRAYERLANLRGESRFYPWLRRIAVNMAIDRLRHNRRGVEVGFDETLFGAGKGAGDERVVARSSEKAERESPEHRAELSEFSHAMQGALEQIGDAHRTVFLLHAAEGMSYREIAETLNCNIGTVMSRLYYARKKLQELLAPHLESE